MITGTYRWWWYNGEVKKGSDVCGGYLWHFQRMCWRIQAVAGIPYWVSHIPNWRQTHRTIHHHVIGVLFPLPQIQPGKCQKKIGSIHFSRPGLACPELRGWDGWDMVQWAKSFRIQLPVTWSILGQNLTRDLAITINLKRTTRIFRFSCGWTPLFSQRSIAISPWLQAENNWHRPESGAVDGPSLRAEWS